MKAKIILFLLPLLLTGCNSSQNNDNSNIKESALVGKFSNAEDIYTKIMKTFSDGRYLYPLKYPQFLLSEGQDVLYRVNQNLQLLKNYTYRYNYTITLGSPGDWGNLQIAQLAVDITGTYTYNVTPIENQYSVSLSNPTGGTEKVYGCNITDFATFRNWTMHSSPDLVNDFSSLSKVDGYPYSKYVQARSVGVIVSKDNSTPNQVLEDLFDPYILELFCSYSTY